MQPTGIRKIVVVGGGTAGWMTAAALIRVFGRTHTVDLVESDDIGTVGVGEATIPPIAFFNQVLGLNEDEFIRETQGTIKLGIEFVDWTRLNHSYIHGFGSFGRQLGLTHFQHFWTRGRQLGVADDWETYAFNAAASRRGKFGRPGPQALTPLDRINWAFHFDAGLYARYLRNYSEARGVKRTEGKIAHVHQNPETGFVESVELENGTRIAGDFFIDCSGFRGLLIAQTLKTDYVDWTEWLPCDRAWAVPCAKVAEPIPYTKSIAREAGWQWRIPLQHRTGNGYVYSSRYISDDEAAAKLLSRLDGKALADPRQLRFTAGRRAKSWVKNVVAVGLASGFLEPLESTSIHLIQSYIARLMVLLPNQRIDDSDIEEFNRLSALEYERIRDFLILHYKATERDDTPFWRDWQGRALPPELARRIAYFQAHGRVSRDHEELFTEPSWIQVMLGQGIEPKGYHPLADQMTDKEVGEFLAEVKAMIEHELKYMPTHQEFIDRNCKAPTLAM